jgi:hypothetical protein
VRRARESEFDHPDRTVFVDEYIRQLEIAMENALRMGGGQAIAELTADVDDFL